MYSLDDESEISRSFSRFGEHWLPPPYFRGVRAQVHGAKAGTSRHHWFNVSLSLSLLRYLLLVLGGYEEERRRLGEGPFRGPPLPTAKNKLASDGALAFFALLEAKMNARMRRRRRDPRACVPTRCSRSHRHRWRRRLYDEYARRLKQRQKEGKKS